MTLVATEHFAGAPDWTWFILFYFFLAGLAGGAYFLATLLRYWGVPEDEPVSRLGYYVPLPATLLGLLLLTLDLKRPLRFWHMLFNTTPDDFGLSFNSKTPMSVGVWVLIVGTIFALVAFVDSLVRDGRFGWRPARGFVGLLDGTVGLVWHVLGTIVYLFIAGYTGVLLAVSNQPVWSDSWALGGLFLASGLAGSAALLLLMTRWRPTSVSARAVLERSEAIFTVLELLLLVVVIITLIDDHTLDTAFGFPWILLWLVALAGMLPGLTGLAGDRFVLTPRGELVARRVPAWVIAPTLVLIGVLALRAAVIFSAQA
jgi:formate-dependent nitrite reductase membrane component NrfD